jgi:methionyl-tRNA formyltransferase
MNIVFAGTPEFAAVVLQGVIQSAHPISAVLTQPDRPSGRGRRRVPGPVKRLATEHGLAVHQPASLREETALQLLRTLAPDVMAVAAYGLLLPPAVLAIPRHGCINVHASLLPRWRGAAPIQRAILAGDPETGVCIMRMEEGLDTGPVLLRRRCLIQATDTAGDLHERLAALGRDALLEALDQLAAGCAREEPQARAGVSYAQRVLKSEARIDWHADAAAVARQIHAFSPSPGAWCEMPAAPDAPPRRLRVLRAAVLPGAPTGEAGEVLQAEKDRLWLACGRGAVALLEVQPAGRRPVSAGQFLNSGAIRRGERLQ